MNKKTFAIISLAGIFLVSCSQDQPDSRGRIAPLRPDKEMTAYIESQNSNAFDIFKGLSASGNVKGNGENISYSPFSFSMLMGMAANGAQQETLEEMKKAVNATELDLSLINDYNSRMLDNFTRIDPGVTFKVANGIWHHNTCTVNPDFRDLVESRYSAMVSSCDLESPGTTKLINSWIEDRTGGAIKDFYDNSRGLGDGFVMVNALHFKAPWTQVFKKSETRNFMFKANDGSEVYMPMMTSERKVMFTRTSSEYMAQIDMGSDRENPSFTLSLILPAGDMDINAYVQGFCYERFSKLKEEAAEEKIIVRIPRFSCQYTTTGFKQILSERDIALPFSRESAQFGRLGSPGFFINEIKQTVSFSVDEDGAEAAAATGMTASTGVPFSFILDRPFMYILTEKSTGNIIFMGILNKPEFKF